MKNDELCIENDESGIKNRYAPLSSIGVDLVDPHDSVEYQGAVRGVGGVNTWPAIIGLNGNFVSKMMNSVLHKTNSVFKKDEFCIQNDNFRLQTHDRCSQPRGGRCCRTTRMCGARCIS